MIKIAPSILSADFSKLGSEVQRIDQAGCDYVHIDVMDGMFVPNLTFGAPIIKAVRSNSDKFFDVHLMIEAPERYIDEFASAGADGITIHQEATRHLHRCIQAIKANGKKAAVSLNPATSLDTLDYVLPDLDMVLLMTVNPGFGGQKFIPAMYDKIKALVEKRKSMGLNFLIEVDGGVSASNLQEVIEAGAEVIVAGSAIFGAPDLEEEIKTFKRIGGVN